MGNGIQQFQKRQIISTPAKGELPHLRNHDWQADLPDREVETRYEQQIFPSVEESSKAVSEAKLSWLIKHEIDQGLSYYPADGTEVILQWTR